MASGATSKYALPYPQPADPPNIPGDVQALANLLDSIIAAAYSGSAANRPAAGKSGRSYYATDTQELSFDTGSAWVALGLVSSSGALITPIVPGQAAGAGASGLAADAAHVHAAPAFSGAGDITESAPGQVAEAGTTGRFADGGHQHSTAAWAQTSDVTAVGPGNAGSAGVSPRVARADHVHATPNPWNALAGTADLTTYQEVLNTSLVDLGQAREFHLTLTANTTLTFANCPGTANRRVAFLLALTQDSAGSRTVTWPTSVSWGSSGAPKLSTSAGKTDWLTFITDNAGTAWSGFVAGLGY